MRHKMSCNELHTVIQHTLHIFGEATCFCEKKIKWKGCVRIKMTATSRTILILLSFLEVTSTTTTTAYHSSDFGPRCHWMLLRLLLHTVIDSCCFCLTAFKTGKKEGKLNWSFKEAFLLWEMTTHAWFALCWKPRKISRVEGKHKYRKSLAFSLSPLKIL